MKKKVCVLTSAHTAFDPRIFLRECQSLSEAGYQVTLIAPHVQDEYRDGIQIKAVPAPHGKLGRFTLTLWHLYREALSVKADIYHVHDPELLLAGVMLKVTTHARIIFDSHEDYPSVVLRRPWIPKPFRQAIQIASRLIIRLCLPFFDGVVAATEDIADRLPHHNKTVVKNYSKLAIGNHGDAHEPNLLVYAGTISRERGLEYFLEAFRIMNKFMPVRLRLVGVRSDAGLVNKLVQQCSPGTVEVFDWVPQPEALKLVASGTIGLLLDLPFAGTDGPPTKLFEYMALGLPAVGNNKLTCRQIIEENNCGIVVDFQDPECVAKQIVELLQDSARIKALREAGFEASKRYRWASQAERLIALYRRLEMADGSRPQTQAGEFDPG
jgi:glycosyltransferase involved in cell wall biosynthesis